MNGTSQIVTLVPFSFLVYVIGTSEARGEIEIPDAGRLAAWTILFLTLILLADFPETGSLAAALAWLIALAVFLTYGMAVFDRITAWIE